MVTDFPICVGHTVTVRDSTKPLRGVARGSPRGADIFGRPVGRGRGPSAHCMEGLFRHRHRISYHSVLLPYADGYLRTVRLFALL